MFLKSSVISHEVAKTLYKKTVQDNMDNDRLNEQGPHRREKGIVNWFDCCRSQ
jgi:hypothetical protein